MIVTIAAYTLTMDLVPDLANLPNMPGVIGANSFLLIKKRMQNFPHSSKTVN